MKKNKMVTKKKAKSKKQEKEFNLFLLVVPIVLGLLVVASYGVLLFNNSITGAVSSNKTVLTYGKRDASSMFSNPSEDFDGISNLFNRIPGVDTNKPAPLFADFFNSFKNSNWYKTFFGSASDKANAWCYDWISKDKELGNYAGFGNGGAYFNLQAEYVDISNPLDDTDVNRIYKIPWAVALPNGNSGEKWNWEIYVSTSDSNSGTSLYTFEDDSTHFIAEFGNGTVDYRGDKMFITTSSNVYDYACIRFFTDDGASLPYEYIPAMPDSGYWCTSIVESTNYDYDAYCKNTGSCNSNDGGSDDGSDTQTNGEQNNNV